jgi:tetratricopeptide (TPR) repeat protein
VAFSKDKAFERAERFAAKGQHDKAAREYQSIVESDPRDVRAWLMLADCLVRCGDQVGAIERYLQVAAFYADQKQAQKSLAVYRQILNLDPRRLDVHQRVAALNMQLGRVQDAINGYEMVAQAQLQAGNINEALATYQIVADADPTAVARRLRLAELYSREKRVDAAVENFRLAGDQLIAGGRKADFVRVAERLIYHRNDDFSTIRKFARVYLELNDPRRALMKLNALLQADPHDHESLELLAETFIMLEKPDKAVSVVCELVRELRAAGPDRHGDAIAIARRGLQWEPGNEELKGALRDLAGTSDSMRLDRAEVVEIDADDSGVVELDESDVVSADSEPVPVHVPEAKSLTETVMSEVTGEAPAPVAIAEDGVDFDKILFEARVYIKYRLFEHAIDHVRTLLERQPEHVGALGLRARALGELGRREEAAQTHAAVARLVADRDPRLAREHLAAALDLVPGHADAAALQETLGLASPGSASAARPRIHDDLGEGDSGAFDLVADEASAAARAPADEPEPEFAIDVADGEPEPDHTEPFSIENRFGLSDARPLPQPDGASSESASRMRRMAVVSDRREAPPAKEHTPAAGFVPRPPAPRDLPPETYEIDASEEIDTGVPDQRAVTMIETGETVEDHDLEEVEETNVRRTVSVVDEMPVASAPAAAAAGDRAWPDLEDELAEIRFYVDQGLDEDAKAALGELDRRHPGHPAVAELRAQLSPPAPAAAAEGAQPLVTFSAEDEDEDAFLSAMFAGGDSKKSKKKTVEIVAAPADVDRADAATHYDLGMAYREMGLVDDAIAQFEAAAKDPAWRARALVMAGTLRVHRGEVDRAVKDLREAVAAAGNDDERSEANYELGLLYEKVGDTAKAIDQLRAVSAGFRDRDEKLQHLQAGG